MNYEIECLRKNRSGTNREIAGDYVFLSDLTDATISDLTWSNRGNGLEVTNEHVHGPFQSNADAWAWIDRDRKDGE